MPHIGQLALQQLLRSNPKQRPALLIAMLDAVPAESRLRMAQVTFDSCRTVEAGRKAYVGTIGLPSSRHAMHEYMCFVGSRVRSLLHGHR